MRSTHVSDLTVLISPEQLRTGYNTEYEGFRDLSKYLLMHFGTVRETFPLLDHPLVGSHGFVQRLSTTLQHCAAQEGLHVRRALDVGCAVGGLSHALATWVEDIVHGIDLSPATIEIARAVTKNLGGTYHVIGAGADTVELRVATPDRRAPELQFSVGSAEALKTPEEPYDAVVLSNILDRVADPVDCLRQLWRDDSILAEDGLVLIACPWSWYTEYSAPEKWLGEFDGSVTSDAALKQVMTCEFELLSETETSGVLRQNVREYDYFDAHTTIWRKA